MIGRAAVIALVAFMTLPTVVVIVVSVNPTAILSGTCVGDAILACAILVSQR